MGTATMWVIAKQNIHEIMHKNGKSCKSFHLEGDCMHDKMDMTKLLFISMGILQSISNRIQTENRNFKQCQVCWFVSGSSLLQHVPRSCTIQFSVINIRVIEENWTLYMDRLLKIQFSLHGSECWQCLCVMSNTVHYH